MMALKTTVVLIVNLINIVIMSVRRSDKIMYCNNCYYAICLKYDRIEINFISSGNIRYLYA